MVKTKKTIKFPKPIIKFCNGLGAILCCKCRTIIKENLTKEEINGKTDIIYCEKCGREAIENFIKARYL